MFSERMLGVFWVSGGMLMHLYLGCFYLWGNIQVYVTSYLHKYDGSTTLADTNIVFVFQTVAQGVWMPIAPVLLRYVPPSMLALIGGCFAIGGVFISSFMTNFYAFVLIYPFSFGIGIGFSYLAPIVWGWEYFPKRRGTVSGLVPTGFGFGSFLFGFLSLAIANPDGDDPDLAVSGGNIFSPENPVSSNAPRMLRINCAIWTALCFFSVLLMRRKSKAHENYEILNEPSQSPILLSHTQGSEIGELQEETTDRTLEIEVVAPGPSSNSIEPTFIETLKDYRTFYLWVMVLLAASFPLYIASNFKTFGQNDINDDTFTTVVGALGAIANGFSRGPWAYLMDRIGFKPVITILLILQLVVSFTIGAVNHIRYMYLIWVFISFSILGGYFSIFPPFWAKIYGPTTGGKTFAVIFTGFVMATIINYLLSGLASRRSIAHQTLFYIFGIMTLICLFMVIFLSTKPKNQTRADQLFSKLRNSSMQYLDET